MSEPTPHKPNRPGQMPGGPTRFSRPIVAWVLLAGLTVLLFTWLSKRSDSREITVEQLWTYLENGQVVGKITIMEDRIEGENDPHTTGADEGRRKFHVIYVYRSDRTFQERLLQALRKHPGKAQAYFEKISWWQGVIPHLVLMLLLILAVWFLLFRRIGSATGAGGFLGSFGRSRHRLLTKEHARVTFNDVAGIEEAKEEVKELIEFLKNPRRFQRLGGRVPRGVLLVGEPGCGKTLLAKAIAGEADVPFFSISGSDFVEMFVGVGASRVRDLFKQAKDSAPCIIFLDEIDAVGRRRGLGLNGGGGHDEREQTLNAILVEMDGFDSSDQVIVIAATNRADVLDPALTRPGRFDRQIDVPLPDLRGRCEILKIYAAKVTCGPDVNLHRLARGTPMFSGADLEAMVNEAAIAATMANKDAIEMADMEEARDKVRWGRARKSRVIDEKEKEITAYHEAGHAMVQFLLPEADPLHKVSIIPRGQMGGATFSLPEKDRYLFTRKYCKALLCVCFGGRLAEEIFCGDVSSGAQNDIAQATEIAKKMVLDWGMSEKLGPINYASDDRLYVHVLPAGNKYADTTARVIDEEIRSLVDEARERTRTLLLDHKDELERVGKALLKYETLSGDEVRLVIEGHTLDKPTVADLLDIEQAKTAEPPASSETKPTADGSDRDRPRADPVPGVG